MCLHLTMTLWQCQSTDLPPIWHQRQPHRHGQLTRTRPAGSGPHCSRLLMTSWAPGKDSDMGIVTCMWVTGYQNALCWLETSESSYQSEPGWCREHILRIQQVAGNCGRCQERKSYPTSVYEINTFNILYILANIRNKKHLRQYMKIRPSISLIITPISLMNSK